MPKQTPVKGKKPFNSQTSIPTPRDPIAQLMYIYEPQSNTIIISEPKFQKNIFDKKINIICKFRVKVNQRKKETVLSKGTPEAFLKVLDFIVGNNSGNSKDLSRLERFSKQNLGSASAQQIGVFIPKSTSSTAVFQSPIKSPGRSLTPNTPNDPFSFLSETARPRAPEARPNPIIQRKAQFTISKSEKTLEVKAASNEDAQIISQHLCQILCLPVTADVRSFVFK